MSGGSTGVPEGLLEAVRERLAAGERLRRTLPGRGRLHVDRRLPFLVVYRRPADRDDAGTDRLVTGQAAYLTAPGDEDFAEPLSRLVTAVVETLSPDFGAFLLVEVWTVPPEADRARDPMVRVVTPDQQGELSAADELAAALEELEIGYWQPQVRRVKARTAAPPELPPLLPPAEANRLNCYVVGLELDPAWRDDAGAPYPELVRNAASQVSAALQRGFFAFSGEKAISRPSAWQGMGRRAVVRAVRKVDEALGEIASRYDFLLAVTPVDVTEAWKRFETSGFRKEPSFRYRPLTADPELLLRQLYAVPLEDIEDPTLDRVYREKLREVARQLTMLSERNTHRFLPGSLQLYGDVEPELLRLAEGLLATVETDGVPEAEEGVVDAVDFALMAQRTFEDYRERYPRFEAELDIRDDVSGLMVSKGRLLIDRTMAVTPTRARALLHHEVGTHVVTWVNGRSQPLQIFRTGLAGYEVLQEGLAVLAEHLARGLTRERLRLLAARVVAAARVVDGASFCDIFGELVDGRGLYPGSAFTTTMRVTRGGGLTKDAVYLRGLQHVATYLRDGGDLEPLFVGKVGLPDLPIVRELLHRGVLREAPVRPAVLDLPGAAERIAELREGKPIVEWLDSSPAMTRTRSHA